jgi:hypothetical protein
MQTMNDKVEVLCNELDAIRDEQEVLRRRQSELNHRSMALDGELNRILHDHLDPLLKGRWSARITLYKDHLRGS